MGTVGIGRYSRFTNFHFGRVELQLYPQFGKSILHPKTIARKRRHAMVRTILTASILFTLATPGFAEPPSPRESVERAVESRRSAGIEDGGIRQIAGRRAGVAIVPRVVKVGFVVAGRRRHGLVMIRTEKGDSSEPTFVTLDRGSSASRLERNRPTLCSCSVEESLDARCRARVSWTLGAMYSIAAGLLGRHAAAATDEKLEAGVLFVPDRGLFVGVSLNGAGIVNDRGADENGFRPKASSRKR